ncbi:hypothetical protein [Herbiconiux daphne]|uniref:Collagen-like protein n=1 Tax=Herbiconiux daphne TaxID=2970914 RepID=A0ABT2HBQ2_9MICO|nr:hypothetical protein [Herbiconiux daphne]MCS5737374.1 hypothetical protein [Herbiconiux daphne]
MGSIVGPQGIQGIQGIQGEKGNSIVVKGSVNTESDIPVGQVIGDA